MLDTITGFLQDYGYGILFLSIFLESTGLPFPGESILIAAGIMAGHGQLDIWGVFAASWIGGTLGDNLGYWLGHRYGRRFVVRYGHRIGLTDEKYRYVEERFRQVGPPIVLIARFILLLRQVCGFAAGTLRFPWWSFLFYNAVGAALWSGAYGFGSYVLGDRIDTYLHGSPWAYAAIGAVFLLLSGGTVLQFRRKLRAQRAAEGDAKKAP
ncbi:DedA family protein [Aureimonas flava]|uniref:DedA family protein n=1 Tax=Aureimonas flava TaxID=2320271 RepID=A0A3A1WN98_9HYPH|nr:DedA family protein [Aureimonas flava]RIY03378.1 DedA family protein [Aureimonas flava]